MWRYESIAVLTPGITPGVGTYLDPAVYLNRLEEDGNETETVAVFSNLNRLLIRYRPRQTATDRRMAHGADGQTTIEHSG
jgi:hypothetical protein